jgi:putative transposase
MRVRPPHVAGGFYHVMLRGNRKQRIFQDDRDYEHLNRLVCASLERYGSEVHAFCWMPNHLHLLLRVQEVPVYRTVHYFATLYAKYFNLRHELVGHLFQGRYKSRLVDSDGYLLQLLRYIHCNPVEGGLVDAVEQYRWGSMRAYLGLDRVDWLTTQCTLSYFDGDRRRLLRFVRAQPEPFDPWEDLDHRGYQRFAELDSATVGKARRWRGLDELIDAACARFKVDRSELEGASTGRTLALARCWIGQQALLGNLATLSQVARLLNRSPAALSKSIKINASRLPKG